MFSDVLSGAGCAVLLIIGLISAGFLCATFRINKATDKRKQDRINDLDRKIKQANQFNRAEHTRLTNQGK